MSIIHSQQNEIDELKEKLGANSKNSFKVYNAALGRATN
jgi:hypothetical protein